MSGIITVECKECNERITATNGEQLLTKKRKHIFDCHLGFEEKINTL